MKSDHEKYTPGPWRWFGSEYGFYLATTHSGRRFVMDFVRMGMDKAQPRFQKNGLMVKGRDLAIFEVGERGVVGFEAAKRPSSGVYRTDIIGFDHPDAQLIATSPELLTALMEQCRRHDEKAKAANFERCGCEDCIAARPVIKKATGN